MGAAAVGWGAKARWGGVGGDSGGGVNGQQWGCFQTLKTVLHTTNKSPKFELKQMKYSKST